MKIKVNNIHFIEFENIKKIEKKKRNCYIYLKKGYPKILKSDVSYNNFILRIINSGINSKTLQEFLK